MEVISASAGKKLKLSFCTTCRDRAGDLRRTLPDNLALLAEGEEVVVLDYNSATTDAWEFICSSFSGDLGAGRLRLYQERSALRFFMSHAKNVCHLLGQGEVLINLDADNYLDPDYLRQLRGWAVSCPRSDMLYPFVGSGGFKGRVAVRRAAFLALGGHDERMDLGYGYEEIDLYRRLRTSGRDVRHVIIDPATAIPTPPALKAAGQRDAGASTADTSLAHRRICEYNLRTGKLVANQGDAWGVAELVDHRSEQFMISCLDGLPLTFAA